MSIYREGLEIVGLAAAKLLAKGAFPCSLITNNPPIIAAFGLDFIRAFPEILDALPRGRKTYVLWKLGYECESQERLKEEESLYRQLDGKGKVIECTYLCNTIKEVENLESVGMRAILCNQNCFIDERRFPVLPNYPKAFDAIYLSRITPCKRHHLAREIEQVKVIGGYLDAERDYALTEMATLPHATWTKKVLGFRMYKHLAAAHVGLCLSDREGAMYASAEYLLCGLPVVSTHNVGGRDEFFDPGYTRTVEPNECAVAQAVHDLIKEKFDPFHIRKETLKKMQVHRDAYLDLLASIFEKEGKQFNRKAAWKDYGFHKLGVRTTVSPCISWNNMLRTNTFR